MDIEFIQSCLEASNYLATKHARIVMAERDITTEQIEKSVEFAEVDNEEWESDYKTRKKQR